MTPLFAKLNLKGCATIAVLNAPPSFESELAELAGPGDVRVARQAGAPLHFALAFVKTQAELDALAATLTGAAEGDAVLWFAYPKQSSRRYRCDFHRDRGWDVLGAAGWESVRMVAIDEDWSALRFRRVEHVKTLRRDPSRARSAAGKARSAARVPPA